MSGDQVFVAHGSMLGIGSDLSGAADAVTCATPLGQVATSGATSAEAVGQAMTTAGGQAIDLWQMFLGLIPGSFGETSTLCILFGGLLLLLTGIASWKIMLSAFAGGAVMSLIANCFATPTYPASFLTVGEQLCLGGFAFAVVFMATDPVTSCRTSLGKYIYGFLVGVVAIIIRTYNNGYPEGAMLSVLLMNALAPLIDYCVVEANVRRRLARVKTAE